MQHGHTKNIFNWSLFDIFYIVSLYFVITVMSQSMQITVVVSSVLCVQRIKTKTNKKINELIVLSSPFIVDL